MPTIVQHYDKKTGKTRVYESTPHYDPVTKQSRPKRKYLGTLDTETGELIPSSGRRGRTSSSKNVTSHDGSNTGTPTSQVPVNKNKVIPNSRRNTGKPKGGQIGHISGQFESEATADNHALNRTYIETCRRNGINEIDALQRLCEGKPYTVAEIFSASP